MRRPWPLLCLILPLLAAPAEARPLPGAPKCPLFPRTSHWNQRVDRLPVHPRSAAIVAAVGRGARAHADFGSGLYEGRPIGIPYRVVGRSQRRVPVRFEYASESDGSRYPIPRDVPIEGGRGSDGDRHVILVDNGAAWYVSGAPSRGWDNDDLHSLGRVRGADFQVVDTARLRRPRR